MQFGCRDPRIQIAKFHSVQPHDRRKRASRRAIRGPSRTESGHRSWRLGVLALNWIGDTTPAAAGSRPLSEGRPVQCDPRIQIAKFHSVQPQDRRKRASRRAIRGPSRTESGHRSWRLGVLALNWIGDTTPAAPGSRPLSEGRPVQSDPRIQIAKARSKQPVKKIGSYGVICWPPPRQGERTVRCAVAMPNTDRSALASTSGVTAEAASGGFGAAD